MNAPDVALRQLESLVAVTEAGGFTRAAEVLRMTQPGMSHTIAGLERELGAPLIERDRGGVRPTEVGERVLIHAREVLGLVERIGHEAAGSKDLRTGRLRIGGFPSATSRILPMLMGAFKDRYPGVEIVLVEGTDVEVLDLIRSREVDVGFVTLPAEELETVPVAEDEVLAVAGRSSAGKRRRGHTRRARGGAVRDEQGRLRAPDLFRVPLGR